MVQERMLLLLHVVGTRDDSVARTISRWIVGSPNYPLVLIYRVFNVELFPPINFAF